MPTATVPNGRFASSFRDPSGYVFEEAGEIRRLVNPSYAHHYQALMGSGLYQELVDARLLVPHQEIGLRTEGLPFVIRPEKIPFISYPYEWCPGQLKEAALLTLEIHRRALSYGLWLKDASAYNVQFHLGRAIFIDTLSFEIHEEGSPWPAYRQFCEHFLAPLVLMCLVDVRLGRLQRDYLDGIPLDLAARLAPGLTKINPGLAIHLHAHARAQTAHADDRQSNQQVSGGRKIAKAALLGIVDSLQSTIDHLNWKPDGTVWADYYDKTNYSDTSFQEKRKLVSEMLDQISPSPVTLWDLGANTGEFTKIASDKGISAIAWDIDPGAVERNYRTHAVDRNLLPLMVDLTNPSPGVGWANEERTSLTERGPVDAILALALIHHLAIGNNVSLRQIATYLRGISPWLIIEFVPKSDSQVQRLLTTRQDIYVEYTIEGFETAFEAQFEIERRVPVAGTERILYLLRRRN